MGQCSIWLMNDKHIYALKTMTPNNNDHFAASWVKRVINSALVLIPGSMSLFVSASAKRICRSRSATPPA